MRPGSPEGREPRLARHVQRLLAGEATGRTADGGCEWREGGPAVPGATNAFGGSAATEFGKPAALNYPNGPATTTAFFEHVYRPLEHNPCPA